MDGISGQRRPTYQQGSGWFVVNPDVRNMRRVLAAFELQTHFLRRDARNAPNRCGRWNPALDDRHPLCSIPALETIAPDSAVLVVIPAADGFHERNDVEALRPAQVDLQPTRGLPFVGIPTRLKVPIVRLVGPHSIRIGTRMNGLARRQVPRRNHNVFAELLHRPGGLPGLSDLLEPR